MSLRRAAAALLPVAKRVLFEEFQMSKSRIPNLSASLTQSKIWMQSGPFVRSFGSSAIANNALADVLRQEIEYEKANYTQPEELAAGPPAPFTLTETRGDTLMSLTRQFGSETINVDVMVNEQPEEEAFENEEGVLDVDVGVLFTAEVVKGGNSLVFECKSDGSYLSILHVALEPTNEELEDSAYTGPVFDELDDELQRQFHVFLEERGINAELGGYLLRLVHDKEQREYQFWLEKALSLVQ